MKDLAALIALAAIWFTAIIVMGFAARALFELAKFGWGLWP